MNRSFPARSTALVALLALTAALGAAGCAKKITTPDASRSSLEGVVNPDVRLIMWPPQQEPAFHLDQDVNGLFVDEVQPLEFPYQNALHFLIMDRSSASRFEVYDRSANGSMSPVFDYSLPPDEKWLDTYWERYSFFSSPSADNPNNSAWLARGVVSGIVGQQSPLSNTVPWRGTASYDTNPTLRFRSAREQADSSQVSITWTTDPNAVGYWMQVLAFDDVEEVTFADRAKFFSEGLPISARRSMLRYVPAASPQGETAAFNDPTAERITNKLTFFMHKSYIVRVFAVNAEGRVINRLQTDYRRVPKDTGKMYYPVGGVVFGTYTLQDRLQDRGLKIGDLASGSFLVPYDGLHATLRPGL
jgi:hypothetical protein